MTHHTPLHLYQTRAVPVRSARAQVRAKRVQVSDENEMIGWATTFLLIALVAAAIGFGGVAGASIELAKIVFFVATSLFLVAAAAGLVGGRSSRTP